MEEGNSDVVEVLESYQDFQESDSVSNPDESTVSTSMEQTTPESLHSDSPSVIRFTNLCLHF